MLIDDLTITTPVRLNGARGMRLRSAPRATGPNTTLGPAVIWGFDGNAIDFGGANDTEVFGLHFRFTGAGGVGAFPNSACFGNQGGVALGEGNAIRRCSTQSQNQTAFPATPNQLRAFVSFSSGVVNNLVIEDNVCDVTDFGIEMPNTATNNFIRILRNTIKQSGLSVAGDAWGIDGIYLGSGDDAQVIGNIIHPPSFDGSLAGDGSGFLEGINLGGVLRVICSQNQIHYTGTTGGTRCIVGNPFYGAVTDNRMESASSLTKGIDVGSLSPTIVTGNVVRLTSATAGPGIVASGNSKVLIQGNVVESASQTSIGIDTQSALGGGGDDCVIADNVVDMTATGVGTSATGIYIRGTGTQRHVVRNNVIRCLSRDGTGVHVSSDVDGCTIGGNSIFGSVAAGSSAVNGVVVEGVNVVVDGNIFANIGLSGAADGYAIKLVDGCSQVTIKSNVVPSTVWRGILVDGGDSNVSGNSLTTGEACVTITTTAVRGIISGNSLQPLTLKALVVTSGALGFVISGNDIIGNSTRVVDLAGTQLVFTGNRMTCGGAGFQIAGNDITVSGNTFVGGDAAQLFISFSGTLSNVAIVGNVFDISCFQLISTGFQHRLNISNNDINAACGAGGLIEAGGGGTDGLKICGNTINMTASGTPTVASSGAVIAVFDGTASAVVDGNTIECNGNFVGDAGRVIYVGFQQGSFSGNRVRFTHVRAATFTYSVLQIGSGAQGLAVTGNALRGDLGGAIIDGSHLSNGIDYVANTSNVTLTGNFIEFLLGIGVTVRGAASKNVLSGNTFLILNAAAGSIGIKVLTGASGIVIVGNNIGSIGDGDGINIAGTIGATIGNNVITGRTASGRGIFVTGATSKNMAITGNFVDGNFGGGDGGIRIDNSVVANAGNIAGNMATIDDNSGAGNTWQKLFTAGAVSTNFPPA
jgi:hypothetical protein